MEAAPDLLLRRGVYLAVLVALVKKGSGAILSNGASAPAASPQGGNERAPAASPPGGKFFLAVLGFFGPGTRGKRTGSSGGADPP